MRIVKLLALKVILVPFMFVMGVVASSAQTLGPLSVGTYQIEFDRIAEAGEGLTAATERLTRSEMNFLLGLIRKFKSRDLFNITEKAHRIKLLTGRSV